MNRTKELRPIQFGLHVPWSPEVSAQSVGVTAFIAAFAIGAGSLSGATGRFEPSSASYWFSHLYAAFAALALWFGIHHLNRRLRLYRDWVDRPLQGMFAPTLFNVALAAGGAWLAYALWQQLLERVFDGNAAEDLSLLAGSFAAVAGYAYRLSFVNARRVRAIRRLLMLRRTEVAAQMAALKAQLDPHFLLNSINTLCHLIETNPSTAAKFTDHMVWTYQYVLDQGQADFVSLRDELEFVQRYFYLLQLRFGTAVQLTIEEDAVDLDAMRIPPLALQTLLENAVKHSELSSQALLVRMQVSLSGVTVTNPIQARPVRESSKGLGLSNLSGRVRLLTGSNVRIENTGGLFSVTVPLLGPAV